LEKGPTPILPHTPIATLVDIMKRLISPDSSARAPTLATPSSNVAPGIGWLMVNAAVHVWPMLRDTTPGIDTQARYPKFAGDAHGKTHADAPMLMYVCNPITQLNSPPNRASLHVQKLGKRNTPVIGPHTLDAVGFIPEPKSRISATWCASTFITASVAVPSTATQVEFSPHVVDAGQENRASMQRTAFGRGEHACTNPAPVALLMHV
jgi:hypothetical protein